MTSIGSQRESSISQAAQVATACRFAAPRSSGFCKMASSSLASAIWQSAFALVPTTALRSAAAKKMGFIARFLRAVTPGLSEWPSDGLKLDCCHFRLAESTTTEVHLLYNLLQR